MQNETLQLEAVDDLTRLASAIVPVVPSRIDSPRIQFQGRGTNNKRGREGAGDEFLEHEAVQPGRSVTEVQKDSSLSSAFAATKRSRNTAPVLQPQYVTLHRVTCSRTGTHVHHKPDCFFLDVPRLFAGDSKANGLRGNEEILNMQEYLEDRPEISFIVFTQYSCDIYCEKIRHDFEQLTMPRLDPIVISQLKLYFSVLKEDGEKADPDSEFVKIVSKDLSTVISDLLAFGHSRLNLHPPSFANGRPVEMAPSDHLRTPYTQFYHLRKRMAGLVDTSNTKLSTSDREHLRLFFEYVRNTSSDDWMAADTLFQQGMVNNTHFNKLFAPGEVLVATSDAQLRAYHLQACIDRHQNQFQLDCTYWTFDEVFKKQTISHVTSWPWTRDLIKITELEIFPLRYDNSGLEDKLRIRGEQFWACRKRAFVAYKTPTPTLDVQTAVPRYMVDNAMYRQMHPLEEEAQSQESDLEPEAMESDEPPADHFLLLLPATIRGYGLHDKKWKLLSVEHMRPVDWNRNAFEKHLVLKPQKKDLIKALISVHIASINTMTTDIIDGKGKGLIILLHGGPGTGKTLTAESVAELAERPLYRVTCGDIGTDPEAVEKYLDSVLYIGAVWGCVVLLDEADIFLEERTQSDLKRNALVSVFLRVLEYYEGILILTTNRVGTFDEAFKSRVQLALHYPPLDEKGRWEIWRNFINALKDEGEKVNSEELRDKIDVLAKHKLNGRQIRNILNTARQLARFRKDVLGYSHLDQAIDVANEFEEYVLKTHGHTDEEYARELGTRF